MAHGPLVLFFYYDFCIFGQNFGLQASLLVLSSTFIALTFFKIFGLCEIYSEVAYLHRSRQQGVVSI